MISKQEGSAASYYIYDGGLSVRALTNEAGTVTDTLVFDAFGNETVKTGSSDNSYGFQGEEKDETGLYYLRARYMDPSTGTFTSMDTYGGSLSDPMSLNKYLFANSNPVMYSDPSGHMTKEQEVAVTDIILILYNALMPTVSAIVSFLSSGFIKALFVIITSAIMSLMLVHFILGMSTTAGDIDDIIINTSISKETLDAFKEKISKALSKAKTIADTQGLPKARSKRELHHIVAKKSLRFNDAHLSRVILSKSGYFKLFALDNADVDNEDNLVYIKTSLHKRLHTYEYHAYVYASLKAVFNPKEDWKVNHTPVQAVLRTIAAQLEALGNLFPDVTFY